MVVTATFDATTLTQLDSSLENWFSILNWIGGKEGTMLHFHNQKFSNFGNIKYYLIGGKNN